MEHAVAASMSQPSDEKWLTRHAREWVEAGFLSEDQAASILTYEQSETPPTNRRLTVVAEVAAYLGSVLTLAGGAAIIGPNWDQLGLVGQGLVAVAIAAVGLIAGTWLVGQGDDGMTRVGSFLWVVGTGGVALGVVGIVNEIDPVDGAWYPVASGIPVLVLGAMLWRNLDRPLQLSTAAVGVGLTGAGLVALTELSMWVAAPVLWLGSLGFGMLAAQGRVHPRLVAAVIAAAGLMVAAFSLMEESERAGSFAAVGSAALVVAFALVDRSWTLVAVGVLAFFIAITSLMATVLQGTLARLVAIALGLIVVAAVAVRAQQSDANPPRARRESTS